MLIAHIVILVVGLILSVGHISLVINVMGLGSGIGGGMGMVVLAGVLFKLMYVSGPLVLALCFLTFKTDRILHPYIFWLSIAVIAILIISTIFFVFA